MTGRTRDGQIWMPFTTAEGLLAKHTGRGEFDAPDGVVAAIRVKDYGPYVAPALGTLPVVFMSTVDITNGNSGSATLNGRGEFVGLAFDGTLEGVISDWAPDADRNRSIHVDSRLSRLAQHFSIAPSKSGVLASTTSVSANFRLPF
ncbi:truncated peptidase S46 (plasmid) [Aminobacter sp. Y103A]|nr:truncated peptidase S46 [Aminobacter sp. SS-2016]